MDPCNKLLHYITYLKFYIKRNLPYIRNLVHIVDNGREIFRIRIWSD